MQRFKLSKRRIAIILIVAATLIDVLGPRYWSVAKTITVPSIIHTEIGYWADQPPVALDIGFLFTAQGSISVNNPVHVHVALVNINISNFLAHYPAIGFTNAYNLSQAENINILTLTTLVIPIKASGAVGQFEADADIMWLRDGPTWEYLLPNPWINRTIKYPSVEVGAPAITIASVSDTLSVRNNVVTQQLTWIAIGFSVLMTQPIFEALFLGETPQTTSTKPRGLRRED